MNRDDWLQQTIYHETDIFEMRPLTNQQVSEMLPDDRPCGWFDPYLLTPQEIDNIRSKFKGSSLKWQQHVIENFPNLNPCEERQIKKRMDKERNLANCGQLANRMNKKGIYYLSPQWCNNYKDCPKCKARRNQEHFDRVMRLDGNPYIIGNRAEVVAHYHKLGIETYSFKTIDGQDITIVKTDDIIEGATGEVSYQMAQQYKEIKVTGTKVSGKAGDEKISQLDVDESIPVLLTSCTFEASEETRKQIEKEYLEETKDFSPSSIHSMSSLLLKCQQIFFTIVQRYCEEIHFISKYIVYITENDLDWTKRQEYIEKRLLWLENLRKDKHVTRTD